MTLEWKPTQYPDLHRIVLPDDPSDADMRSMLPDDEDSAEMLRVDARTWWEDDRILAIVGVSEMWKGVGTVWTLISDAARARGVALTRGILRFLEMLRSERGYWRLQATTIRGDEPARLWIVQLRFKYEGTMVAYGPDGVTHDMYARVRF